MEDSYIDLKNEVSSRYSRLFRYTIMNVFIVLICNLIVKNIRLPGSKIVEFLNQFLGEIEPIFLAAIVYVVFSNAVTYLIRKDSENDVELFKAVDRGLNMEAKHYFSSRFFQDFVHKFEGIGMLIVWGCRIFPLALFGFRFLRILCKLLDGSVPLFIQALLCGFGFAAWVLWLHRVRFLPLKVLIKKKTELFGI